MLAPELVPGLCCSCRGVIGRPSPAGELCLMGFNLEDNLGDPSPPGARAVPPPSDDEASCFCCSLDSEERGPFQLLLAIRPLLEGRCMTISWRGRLAVPGRLPGQLARVGTSTALLLVVGNLSSSAVSGFELEAAFSTVVEDSSCCIRAAIFCSFLVSSCCRAVRCAGVDGRL